MKVWVLTDEYNDYDQHGEYFIAVFINKPTHEQLTAHGVDKFKLHHVLNGGGRTNNEYQWFNLTEHTAY